MYPKKFLHSPSWDDCAAYVGFKADFFKASDFVKCLGKAVWKWDWGIALQSAPGSTFT